MQSNKLRLDDSVVGHIAKVLQVALLTGTDIIDHMRMIRLDLKEEGHLFLDKEYQETFDNSLDTMLQNAQQQTESE